MSTFSTTCDALIEDLTDNVATLQVNTENVHRYVSWFPEELLDNGYRHLAVFPAADGFDTVNTQGAPLGGHFREQVFVILVWESAGTESIRAVSDEQGAKDFLDLYEAILARLYVTANQSMANAWKQWFVGAEVPSRSSSVRWFRILVRRYDTLSFS